jgi:hypothetical protein
VIHVFFCASAAGTFRQLLHARGIAEEVADISEELDFGPISHGALADRETWFDQFVPMDFGNRDWLAKSEARFKKYISRNPERLVWIAPASATEQAGLYWYLSQFGGNGTTLAIADYPFDETWNGKPPLKLGELGLDPMGQLYDACPRVLWDPARFPADRWSALVAENALIRVVHDGRLRSAPDDNFDNFLLTRTPTGWVKWHRVIGDTMGDIWDTGQSASSELLLWRLRTLIAEGQIACDGDPPLFGGSVSDAVKIRRAG